MAKGSLRSMMRGDSSASSSETSSARLSDEANSSNQSQIDTSITMQGWMRKQKETFRTWARRYFTLSGKVLTYYDSENISGPARGVIEVADVSPLTTEDNGLALHLENGKEVRLIADTHVAYRAWLMVLTAAVKEPSSTRTNKGVREGWAHCLTEDEIWTRYFVVVKNDSFSCYASEDEDAELELSGLVRSVAEWDGKRYGLVIGLNRSRIIKLCFDSAEEKMTWFLTLEYCVSYTSAQMKKEASLKLDNSSFIGSGRAIGRNSSSTMLRRSSTSSKPVTDSKSDADVTADEDDGVWI